VLFDQRSFEARHPEEAELGGFIDQQLEEWYTALSQEYDHGAGRTKGALFLAANLWQLEHKTLQEQPMGELQANLLQFDEHARDMPGLELGMFYDPREFLSQVDMSWAHQLVHAKYAILKQHMLNVTKLQPKNNDFDSFVKRISDIVQPGKRTAPKVDPGNASAASTQGKNKVLEKEPKGDIGKGKWESRGSQWRKSRPLSDDKHSTTERGNNHEPAVPAPKGEAACAGREVLKGAESSASAWIGKGCPIGAKPTQAK